MHVIDDSGRNVQTRPAGKPPAKSNTGFVDAVPVVTEQDLAGAHADARSGFDSFDEFLEPSRLRLRVIVQCCDVAAFRPRNARIAPTGESLVGRQNNNLQTRLPYRLQEFQ